MICLGNRGKSTGAVGDTYSDTSKDEPDPIVAYAEFDRYLSQLDSEYLKQLAAEIKGGYIEGQDTEEFYTSIQSQKPSASFVTAYSLRWLYLSLAILMLLLIYAPEILSLKILKKLNYAKK